ncbi:MAG: hypothetical protein ACP5E2_16315 [Terracidiphilus sp.]
MQNAHLRLGLLEYHRITEKTSTRIRVRVSSYIGEDEQAHLIGVFGNDSDIGAITAAVHEKAYFTLTFPDGAIKEITLGEHASCYRGSVTLPGRKHPVRHLIAISEQLHANGSAGQTILCRKNADEVWAWLSNFLGLPAVPDWAEHICGILEADGRFQPLDGIGCQPVLVTATADEMLTWISAALKSGAIAFPEENGPVKWPKHHLFETLRQIRDKDEQ